MNKDYTKFSNHKTEVTVKEEAVIIESPEVEVVVPEPKYGYVANCMKLNVRCEADPCADVVTVLERDDEVIIVEDESTLEFYKVCTATGAEGFCMRNFIEVK